MDILRLTLFSGLLFHKLLWEVLKRTDGKPQVKNGSRPAGLSQLMKVAKILLLFFLLIQTLFLDLFPISGPPSYLRPVGVTLFFAGLAMAVVGRLQLGSNWIDLEERQVLPGQSLVIKGLYRYVRHPIYFGDFLLVLGLELALRSWLFWIACPILVVIVRQAREEERLLHRVFPEYEDYRLRTKMFIPFVI